MIKQGLSLDLEKKEWTAAYPFRLPPESLPDNSQQALMIAERDRKRLVKNGEHKMFVEVFEEGKSIQKVHR